MSKIYIMGTFSDKGLKGLVQSENDREKIVKKTCKAIGVEFISFDILQGEIDFIGIFEGDYEQGVSFKAAIMLSGDFNDIVICNSISLEKMRDYVKKISNVYIPPSG